MVLAALIATASWSEAARQTTAPAPSAQDAAKPRDMAARRSAVVNEVTALRGSGQLERALQVLDEYDVEVLQYGNGSVYNRYRVRVERPSVLMGLGRHDEARACASADIAAIEAAVARARAAKDALPAGAELEGADLSTFKNWTSGYTDWLLALFHTELGFVFHQLGLVDRAATEATTASRWFRIATEKKETHSPGPRQWLLQSNVFGGQDDVESLRALVEEIRGPSLSEKLSEKEKPHYRRNFAVILGHLGALLVENARLEPETFSADARATLEAALAMPEMSATATIEPELALATLDLREARLASCRERLARVWSAFGDETRRARHAQLNTYLALEARVSIAEAEAAGKLDGLAPVRDRLAARLDECVAQFESFELASGGHGLLNYRDLRGVLSELIRLERLLDPGRSGIEKAYARVLSVERASSLGRRLGAPPVDLARLRSGLFGGGDGHALVHFHFGPDRSDVFVVDGKEIVHQLLPPMDAVKAAVSDAVEELGRTPAAPAAPAAKRTTRATPKLAQLAADLFPASVAERLRAGARLTLVGRELVGSIPFEALPSTDGVALGLRAEICDVPTVSVGVFLAQRARSAARPAVEDAHLAWIGMPEQPKLSVGRDVAEAALAPFSSKQRRFDLGAAATREALFAAAPWAHSLVVFTHGKHDYERDDPATLLFQGGDTDPKARIGARELETFLAPPLTILMACGADLTLLRRGDAGSAGFAGAILGGGQRAQCVVLSAHDLDSGAAAAMARWIHESLARGRSPSGALLDARRAMAASVELADPTYWALLRVVGAGHEPIFAP